jgi:hypothetical protein
MLTDEPVDVGEVAPSRAGDAALRCSNDLLGEHHRDGIAEQSDVSTQQAGKLHRCRAGPNRVSNIDIDALINGRTLPDVPMSSMSVHWRTVVVPRRGGTLGSSVFGHTRVLQTLQPTSGNHAPNNSNGGRHIPIGGFLQRLQPPACPELIPAAPRPATPRDAVACLVLTSFRSSPFVHLTCPFGRETKDVWATVRLLRASHR